MGKFLSLAVRSDDEGPKSQTSLSLPAANHPPPDAPPEQFEHESEDPGPAQPGSRKGLVPPDAADHDEHDADAGSADDPAKLFGRREVLNSVEPERLKDCDPAQRGEAYKQEERRREHTARAEGNELK